MVISGKEVLPLIEGGKGVAISTGASSGAWAAAGGVGTFSGVNADFFDENGVFVPVIYNGKTRRERHAELIAYGIKGGIAQARIAHDISGGNGRMHMNVLWEMGGAEEVLTGVLEGAKGLVHGVTCGAGMPYKVAEIAAHYGIHYYPIISSARAFKALWKRAYHKYAELLGGVVYEDPWLAGGHNGLTNSEDPLFPQDPLPRVRELRNLMREMGCPEVPIFMAGGVWFLRDWQDFIGNPELGPIAFQYGTRPLLTVESPISDGLEAQADHPEAGRHQAASLQPHRLLLVGGQEPLPGRTLPAVRASDRLQPRSRRRTYRGNVHRSARPFGLRHAGGQEACRRLDRRRLLRAPAHPGFDPGLVTPEKSAEIRKDQVDCMGCLSACAFSNWSQGETGTTGKRADPAQLLHPKDPAEHRPWRRSGL